MILSECLLYARYSASGTGNTEVNKPDQSFLQGADVSKQREDR